MSEPITPENPVRAAGLVLAIIYAAFIGWLYVRQPQTVAQVTGGLSAAVGAYRIDDQALADALRFFNQDQFVEARIAFARADPASRDARTQFYIAYSYYRQGWRRLYHDDALYREGVEAVDRAIALAPGGRLIVEDPTLQIHTADELKAELQAGLRPRPVRSEPDAAVPPAQMTAASREAIVLPLLFLTVALGGGLRMSGAIELVPPSPFALVLGLLLLRLLVQSGTLAATRLLASSRSLLENANGGVVMVTLWLASAQVFTLLTPTSGLPRIAFNLYFLLLMLNTAAADPDRPRLIRSLVVTFGATYILKFIVLAELSDPGSSRLARVLQVLLEGITLGTLTQAVQHPAVGYIALFVVALFVVGVFLLPYRYPDRRTRRLPA